MSYKDDKSLSFEKFKERVYKRIGTIESLLETDLFEDELSANMGCLEIFISVFVGDLVKFANRKFRIALNFKELSLKADEILAQAEIKDLICSNLDATVILPIEAAYKLTPVLYELAQKDEGKIPVDSILFAIICRKITKQGVENYCPPKETKKRERKSGQKEP